MFKSIYQIHFLLFCFICICNSHPLSKEPQCSIRNVEKTLQLTLEFINLVKESEFQSPSHNDVDYELIDIINGTKKESRPLLPSNCAEIQYMQGHRQNGIFEIYLKGRTNSSPMKVYCDFKTEGGGWTVFQRRDDFGEPRENFFRNWTDYKNGFGGLNKEFWLGNDLISVLTIQDRMTLRIDLEDFEGTVKFAEYSEFRVKGEALGYNMTYSEYSGNAGNSLERQRGTTFTTFDRDNKDLCSSKYKGGWWYSDCHNSNLNGLYLTGSTRSTSTCTNWYHFQNDRRCMKRIEMKMRPEYFVTKEHADSNKL